MAKSSNGAKPQKTTEEVAADLRDRLERQIGRDRTEAIWRDPTNVREVLHDEDEAASVAGVILQAWRELPEEDSSEGRGRRFGFRRGLRLAFIAAFAVWAVSILNKVRSGEEEL